MEEEEYKRQKFTYNEILKFVSDRHKGNVIDALHLSIHIYNNNIRQMEFCAKKLHYDELKKHTMYAINNINVIKTLVEIRDDQKAELDMFEAAVTELK